MILTTKQEKLDIDLTEAQFVKPIDINKGDTYKKKYSFTVGCIPSISRETQEKF